MTSTQCIGTAREAGRNIVHTITRDGVVIGTRRSAHRYNYAMVRRMNGGGYTVTRWSRSATTRGSEFAVYCHAI